MKRFCLLASFLAALLALAAPRRPRASSSSAPARHAAAPAARADTDPCAASCHDRLPGSLAGGPRTRSTSAATATRGLHGHAPEADGRPDRLLQRRFGTPAEVRLSVLRRGDKRKTRLNHRLLNQSDNFQRRQATSAPSPTFVLRQAARGEEGQLVAITVPTWAPLLSHEPGAYELVALLPGEGQLRAAQEPPPFALEDAARGQPTAAPTTARGCSTRPPTSGSATDRDEPEE